MESPYNGGDSAPTRHIVLTSKISNARNGLYITEPLAKDVTMPPPQTSQTIANSIGYSL